MNKENPSKTTNLRQKAEEQLKQKSPKTSLQLSETDILKLNHELQVHQIELEIQNEELNLTNEKLIRAKEKADNNAQKYTELYDFAPMGYFTLSTEGEIIVLNLAGAKMLGKGRQNLFGNRFGFFVSEDTKPIFNLFLNKVFTSVTKESCELKLSVEGNSEIYVQLSGIARETGKPCFVTMVDITEIKEVKELLFQNDEKAKCAAELIVANKELLYQNEEKAKRAAELIVANKELTFQNEEKAKRAAELIVANKELLYQNEEKAKRAAELVIAKDKAEESDRLKTSFINNISHEIRTPLNGILGFAPFIIQPDITMEEKREYLEILETSSNRLINTIDDIMDISLIISGNMEVHPQPINISSLLMDIFEQYQEPTEKKNLNFKIQFPDNAYNYILHTDGEMLRKAVSKIADNSVKFTKEGSVALGFALKESEIEIFVKDTGVGIEKDTQENIYKHFSQEDISLTRGYEGSGLGLSIAKGMIQLLGGEIRLESTKNVGTTVFLTLPNITSTDSTEPKNLAKAIEIKGMPLILIAEDEDCNYSYIETLLRKDCNTLRAFNGQEAVDLCKKHPDINLVLMDIKMPIMNGIEATHIIKSFRNDLPIIAVTAFAQSGDEFKIKEAGCDDYLSKPIKKAEILSLIQLYLKSNY